MSISRLYRYMVFLISQQPQRVRYDDQRTAFVEDDGDADTDNSCQGGDDEQSDHAE